MPRDPRPHRHIRVLAAAGLAACLAQTVAPGAVADDRAEPNVFGLTISEIAPAMASGQVTAVELVDQYLARIAAYDDAYGDLPGLNAIIALNPDARAQAAELDAELETSGPRGPLHGVPILIKTNYETTDLPTTGGSILLADHMADQDATLVAKLRAAGAIVIGKTNMDEWAFGWSGTSSAGGQVRNPYDQSYGPGGSSGGTGAGVAAGFGAAGLGSDTCGSVRLPAAVNNLVGLRPTLGVLSRAGIIPFAAQQDTGGPIAQSVEDVAILMDVLAGPDERDPITEQANAGGPESYGADLSPDALQGRTIGLVVNPEFLDAGPTGASTTEVIRAAADDLRAQGASVVEVTLPDEVIADNQTSLFIIPDMAADLDHYFATAKQDFPADIAALTEPKDAFTFSDVVASKAATPGVQQMLELVNPADTAPESRANQDREAQEARERLQVALTGLMSTQGLDALAYPTVSGAVPEIGTEPTGVNCALASMAGYPALSVPAGFTPDGRPVGLELLGLPNSDGELLAMGYAYEQATEHHRAAPTVPALAVPENPQTAEEARTVWVLWAAAGVAIAGAAVLAFVLIRRRRPA